MRVVVAVFAGSLLALGCSSGSTDHRRVTEPATTPSRASCATPTRFGADGTAHEIRGVGHNAELRGIALGPGPVPPRAGEELKIVWRMTGAGPLRIAFIAPDGHRTPLVFGPEAHSGSSYHRPGDEWGTGFRFVTRGCWHIHFARDNSSADVWLTV